MRKSKFSVTATAVFWDGTHRKLMVSREFVTERESTGIAPVAMIECVETVRNHFGV